MIICIFTGFSSGLPFSFITSLIAIWLTEFGVSKEALGLMTLIGMPYMWKFLWAPFLDVTGSRHFGRRRTWMLLMQFLLLLCLFAYRFIDAPQDNLHLVVLLTLLVCFFSATQDIALDAYRREILPDNELALGNAIHVNAYRIAQLIPSSLSLILIGKDMCSWASIFLLNALCMLPGMVMTIFIATENNRLQPREPITWHNWKRIIIEPLQEFFARKGFKGAMYVLSFIFLYKLGDSMATALISRFYLDMGFSPDQLGSVVKYSSLSSSIIGGILGGIWMLKIGVNRALWYFGVVQVVTILGFAYLAHQGPFTTIGRSELILLSMVVCAEYFGVGVGTAAFLAFIARETNPRFTATQISLFTSIAAMPRTLISASVGYLISALGYEYFFYLCFLLAFPGMLLLIKVAPFQEKK